MLNYASMAVLDYSSTLPVAADTVWRQASSFAGVNRELWPLHMSAPPGARLTADTPTGRVLFRSRLTLLRLLPLDLHSFGVAVVWPGRGFREQSHSLLQRRWVHTRTIAPIAADRCLVRDELEFEPRLLPALVTRVVHATFQRRHARLRVFFDR
jgi:hypothetical protein